MKQDLKEPNDKPANPNDKATAGCVATVFGIGMVAVIAYCLYVICCL